MRGWLESLFLDKRVLVALGSGGVGKTTLAATIALQAALAGRRALVLTIDPARRLATALGLRELSAEPQRVPLTEMEPSTPAGRGELQAMMLDASRSLDSLVSHHASTPEARERIFGHRLYRQMVEALAGTHDLAAMEELYKLVERDEHDLIVLDTPPKEHAFDFLDAPSRLIGLLAQTRLKWLLLRMTGLGKGSHLKDLTARLVLRTLSRFTGPEVLRDLASLSLAMLDLGEGLKQRSRRVQELLASEHCAFLVVTRPDPFTVNEALSQRRKLGKKGLPFGGFLVNRCHYLPEVSPGSGEDPLLLATLLSSRPEVADLLPPEQLRPLLERLLQGLELIRIISEQERSAIARLRREGAGPVAGPRPGSSQTPIMEIPELPEEIHSTPQLLRFGRRLIQPQLPELSVASDPLHGCPRASFGQNGGRGSRLLRDRPQVGRSLVRE